MNRHWSFERLHARARPFEEIGHGCEGSVLRVQDGKHTLKIKRFRHLVELKRFVIGSIVLDATVRQQGWARHVALPRVLSVAMRRKAVVCLFVKQASINDAASERRLSAMTALICAAGLIASASSSWLLHATRPLRRLGLDPVDSFILNGVDVGIDNLIYDGTRWNAVDF